MRAAKRRVRPDNGRVAALLAGILPETITPYLALMLAGFAVGAGGHLYKSKVAVAIGILMIFLATLLLPLAVVITQDSPSPSGPVFAPGTR